MTTYSHLHSGMDSVRFRLEDAVMVEQQGPETWAVYLDSGLNRWEVFVDAEYCRVFIAEETWDQLDGPAQVQFRSDFIVAYRASSHRELRILTDEVYQAGARRRAAKEGTATAPECDRVRALKVRVDEAITAAAGMQGAASAAQMRVFAVRHASIVQDLEALEAEMDRLRTSVELSGSALSRVLL